MTPQEQELVQLMQALDNPWVLTGFILLSLWTVVWKGIALWRASSNRQMIWFVVMLLANTVGILEIVYIFFFSKKKEQQNV
jgi:hypothetical protein